MKPSQQIDGWVDASFTHWLWRRRLVECVALLEYFFVAHLHREPPSMEGMDFPTWWLALLAHGTTYTSAIQNVLLQAGYLWFGYMEGRLPAAMPKDLRWAALWATEEMSELLQASLLFFLTVAIVFRST